MMTSIVELAVSLVELLEIEGQRFGRRVSGLVVAIGLKLGAVLLLVVGLAWLIWAGFIQLNTVLVPAASGAIMGLVTLMFAGGLLWASNRQ
jgi:hypothetical protein